MITYEEILDNIKELTDRDQISAIQLKNIEKMVTNFKKSNPRARLQIAELDDQIALLTAIHNSNTETTAASSSYAHLSASGLAKPSKLTNYADILDHFNNLKMKEKITLKELENMQSLLQTFQGSSDQIKSLTDVLNSATERYYSSSPMTAAGAGFSTSRPSSSVKRTKYADNFDRIQGDIREYQSLNAVDKLHLSLESEYEMILRLSALEEQVIKVLEGEASAAISYPNSESPKLNNPIYSQRVKDQLQSKDFPATRQVRGDGNCYYRSVIYAFLEQVVCADPSSGIKLELIYQLKEKITLLIGMFGEDFDRDLQDLLKKLSSIEEDGDYSLKDLQTDMLDTSRPSFDHLLVRAARALTAKTLIEDEENIAPFLEQSFDDYVMDTLSMKKDADGVLIETNYLGSSLGVNIELKNLAENGTIYPVSTKKLSSEPYFNIHLLRDDTHRGGVDARGDSGVAHYFILYDREQKTNIDKHLFENSAATKPKP